MSAKTENSADRAYRELRDALMAGRLPTDHKVTEAGLAQMLGLSRTPVRAAVSRLLIEGFLQRRSGSGMWCVVPNRDEMQAIFDIRVRLESYAASRAAMRASPAQCAQLTASARRMSDLVAHLQAGRDPDTVARIEAENALFHGTILEASGALRLSLVLKSTVDVAFVSLTLQRYSLRQRLRSAGHHHEIAEAIAAGMADWAGRAMEVHILSAAATFLGKPDDASD